MKQLTADQPVKYVNTLMQEFNDAFGWRTPIIYFLLGRIGILKYLRLRGEFMTLRDASLMWRIDVRLYRFIEKWIL